jgi:hypothetical protein
MIATGGNGHVRSQVAQEISRIPLNESGKLSISVIEGHTARCAIDPAEVPRRTPEPNRRIEESIRLPMQIARLIPFVGADR